MEVSFSNNSTQTDILINFKNTWKPRIELEHGINPGENVPFFNHINDQGDHWHLSTHKQ